MVQQANLPKNRDILTRIQDQDDLVEALRSDADGQVLTADDAEYDEARTCAVQKLEQAKTLPYETVEAGLQDGICEPSGFGYQVVSQPVDLDLGDGSGDEGLTMITVTVDWAGRNSYDVSGVVSRW